MPREASRLFAYRLRNAVRMVLQRPFSSTEMAMPHRWSLGLVLILLIVFVVVNAGPFSWRFIPLPRWMREKSFQLFNPTLASWFPPLLSSVQLDVAMTWRNSWAFRERISPTEFTETVGDELQYCDGITRGAFALTSTHFLSRWRFTRKLTGLRRSITLHAATLWNPG